MKKKILDREPPGSGPHPEGTVSCFKKEALLPNKLQSSTHCYIVCRIFDGYEQTLRVE